jgi:CRISPR-associated protein Csm5
MNLTEHVEIRLSTLSPVHIGCGEDYEPTGFVIQNGALYHFDPSIADLPPNDRKTLLGLVESPRIDMPAVRRFFKDRSQHFLPHATRIVPVTPAVEASYQKSFTDQQARNDAKLEIDRTFYNPFDGQPVVPGSSIKGAIRTAVLDALNADSDATWQAKQHMAMQKALMGGSFHTDPLRLFKVSDARYRTPNRVGSKILFAVSRRKKTKVLNGRPDDQGKGIPTYKECLPERRYHAFDLTLDFAGVIARERDKQPSAEKVLLRGFKEMAKICNHFYGWQLVADIKLLQERGFADEAWAAPLLKALQTGDLRQRLENGQACLLRVGRHSGAVSMTLNGLRQIKIMQAKGTLPAYENDTRQIWLAADQKDATRDMLPFGWVLLEPASASPCASLNDWFSHAAQQDDGWLEPRLAQFQEWRSEIDARKAKLMEQAAREAEAAALAKAEAKRRASLTQAGQEVETLRDKFTKMAEYDRPNKPNRENSPGGPMISLMRQIMASALDPASGWNDAERRELAALCREQAKAHLTLGGKEKEIKAQWRQLEGA